MENDSMKETKQEVKNNCAKKTVKKIIIFINEVEEQCKNGKNLKIKISKKHVA